MKIVSLTFHPYLASIINNNEVLDEKNNNNNAETTIDQPQSGKPETGSKRKLAVEAKNQKKQKIDVEEIIPVEIRGVEKPKASSDQPDTITTRLKEYSQSTSSKCGENTKKEFESCLGIAVMLIENIGQVLDQKNQKITAFVKCNTKERLEYVNLLSLKRENLK